MSITVDLPGRAYDIHVGTELLERAGTLLPLREHAQNVVVVTQLAVATHHLTRLKAGLSGLDQQVTVIEVPVGESAKSTATLGMLWDRFAELSIGRSDVIMAFGGGVVGDLAGFVAATWNRGIDVVQVPTTLLAQVDSAIGGKTGINLTAGKNLVGAFHQPRAVLADTATLATLPTRERVAGLGEVVKYGWIRDPQILTLLEADPLGAVDGAPELLEEIVRRSAAVKAAVVAADERESGERAHLNFGHTFGHAVEALTGYTEVLHGEAVAIGMAMALRLGVLEGLTPSEFVDRNDELCRTLGLPTTAPVLARPDVWATMARDKKAQVGIRWALLKGIGEVTVEHADPGNVDRAIDMVSP